MLTAKTRWSKSSNKKVSKFFVIPSGESPNPSFDKAMLPLLALGERALGCMLSSKLFLLSLLLNKGELLFILDPCNIVSPISTEFRRSDLRLPEGVPKSCGTSLGALFGLTVSLLSRVSLTFNAGFSSSENILTPLCNNKNEKSPSDHTLFAGSWFIHCSTFSHLTLPYASCSSGLANRRLSYALSLFFSSSLLHWENWDCFLCLIIFDYL